MNITAEMLDEYLVLHVLFISAEDDTVSKTLKEIKEGDGWKKYDAKGNLISVSIRLWENSDFTLQADALIEAVGEEIGIEIADQMLDKIQVLVHRLYEFGKHA